MKKQLNEITLGCSPSKLEVSVFETEVNSPDAKKDKRGKSVEMDGDDKKRYQKGCVCQSGHSLATGLEEAERLLKRLIRKSSKTPSKTKDMIATCELPATATHLAVTTLHTLRFYMLPKIHKPNNPGGPIVSACCCPTENIASYVKKVMVPQSTLNLHQGYRPCSWHL
ncbi:hypothetical protein ACROYT_G013948 [Oculina patagonica]